MRRYGNWAYRVAALLFLTAAFTALAAARHDLQNASAAASVLSFFAAILQVYYGWLAVRVQRKADPGQEDADTKLLRTFTDEVRSAVRSGIEDGLDWRMLSDSRRYLPVSWATVGPPIADHWSNVRADGIDAPLRLDGALSLQDGWSELAWVVTSSRLRHRLLILGDTGSGKTIMLYNLALTLVASPLDELVPVVLRLSTWDPGMPVKDWITTRLVEDYGVAYQSASAVVRKGLVFPLYDGIDELPAAARGAAQDALLRFAGDGPFVMTSRQSEYADAVHSGSRILNGAAVIVVNPTPPNVAREYLRRLPAPARTAWWDHLFETDTAEHAGRLSAMLSTPLLIGLMRQASERASMDEVALLAIPDREALEDRLLDGVVAMAFPVLPGGSDDQRVFDPAKAEHWLGAMASHLRRESTQDLAWWRLATMTPRWFRIAACSAAGAAAGMLTGSITGGATGGIRGGFAYGLAGVVSGAVLALILGGIRTAQWPPEPSRAITRYRSSRDSPRRRAALAVLAGLEYGSVAGLVFGLGVALKFGYERSPLTGLVDGLLFGVAVSLVFALLIGPAKEFTTLFGEAADTAVATRPETVLDADRIRWLAGSLFIGAATAVSCWVAGQMLHHINLDLTVTLTGALFSGVMVGFVASLATRAWWWFQLAKLWLVLTGQAPWAIMAFLREAHGRRVLRQTGAAYEFSHASLRDHLADRFESRRP